MSNKNRVLANARRDEDLFLSLLDFVGGQSIHIISSNGLKIVTDSSK